MLTHIQRVKTWQLFLCMMCVNKIYGSGKCCTKENKNADAFEAYQKEIQLFVNKVGFWEDAAEFQKVSTYHQNTRPSDDDDFFLKQTRVSSMSSN
jgi:hypothetical protein